MRSIEAQIVPRTLNARSRTYGRLCAGVCHWARFHISRRALVRMAQSTAERRVSRANGFSSSRTSRCFARAGFSLGTCRGDDDRRGVSVPSQLINHVESRACLYAEVGDNGV